MNGYQPAYPVGQPVPQPGQPAQGGGNAVSPETVQAVLALQQQQGQQQRIQRQMQQAQAMRAMSMKPAESGRGGSLAVAAPNWAGTLAQIYAGKKAKDMQDDADVQGMNADTQRQDAMRRYFEALTSQQRQSGE